MVKNPDEIGKFNERLKQLRIEAGLTQAALAFGAGISTRTIQRIEAGDMNVSMDLFFSILRALEVQPGVFFKGFQIEMEE